MINYNETKKFLKLIAKTDLNYFISGGVGLDGLRGKWTREHLDIDVYLFEEDFDKLIEFVKKNNYRIFRVSISSGICSKLKIQGRGIMADVLVIKKEGNFRILIGTNGDCKIPNEIFKKHDIGKLEEVSFKLVPNEIFVSEMEYSKFPEDKKEGTSLKCDKELLKKIEYSPKEREEIELIEI